MAKINGVLIPKASGSIGNITFRSSGRNTVASEKIVTNSSRTEGQLEQRLRFKERMEIAVRCKESAPFMFKKKGFRSAFSELSSRVMTLRDQDFDRVTRSGFLNILDLAQELGLPIVQGEVSATKVVADFVNKKIKLTALAANFIPNKSEPEFRVTAAAIVTSSETSDSGKVNVLRLDDLVINVGLDGHLLYVELSIDAWPWSAAERSTPLPSINVNGKRIGYGIDEYEVIPVS